MNVLLLRREKTIVQDELKKAFKEKNFNVRTLNLKKLSLYSDSKKTSLENDKISFNEIDAVYLSSNLSLAPFIEPLLEIFEEKNIYCQHKIGSYYLNSNESYQFHTLNSKGVKISRLVTFGQLASVASNTKKFSYPVLFKVYSGSEKKLTALVESPRSLKSLAQSIKFKKDGILVREFVEGDVIQCAVIGEKVYAIRRESKGEETQSLQKGMMTKLSTQETETVKRAARVLGLDIATVKICKGYVFKVIPGIDYLTFNKKTGNSLFEDVADFYKKQLNKKND